MDSGKTERPVFGKQCGKQSQHAVSSQRVKPDCFLLRLAEFPVCKLKYQDKPHNNTESRENTAFPVQKDIDFLSGIQKPVELV